MFNCTGWVEPIKIEGVPKAELEPIDNQDTVIFHGKTKINKKPTKTNGKKLIFKRKLHTWIEPANKKITQFFKPFKIKLQSEPEIKPELSCTNWAWDGGGVEEKSILHKGVGGNLESED